MAQVLNVEEERVVNITNAFTLRKVHSVSYYGRTFFSLEAFSKYRKLNKITDSLIS